ncbi:MAG: hypothetical protein ACXVBW_14575, partial [Bdellovibrionota bacterium]
MSKRANFWAISAATSILLHGLCAWAAPEATEFDRVEEGTVHFKTTDGSPPPKALRTSLFELTFLGKLTSAGGYPDFLFAGRSCQNCMEDKSIFAMKPGSGHIQTFVFPGKILEPKTRAVVVEARAFYGRCLPKHGDVYVVFQREHIDRRRGMQSSVFIAEGSTDNDDHLKEQLIERHLPNIRNTVRLVKLKQCHEVEGRNRLMLSKPLDLHPRANVDNDDDDDDTDKAGAADS